jgi:hypothetical protein
MSDSDNHPSRETQESVTAWCNEHYPGADEANGIRRLFEEATELAAAINAIDLEGLLDTVRKSWEKSQKDRGDRRQIPGEIADVRIAEQWLASALNVDEQAALDDKMAVNRKRTVSESQARQSKKDHIYKPD